MPASLHPDLGLLLLLACCHTPGLVGATVPAAPVNVSVTQLRAHSAMVTWNIPQGDTVIGYSISQQRQDGLMQRSIREVNTSSRWCVLWDLDEDTHYSVQVQSVGPHADSQPSRAVHFRTLERSDHYPAGVLDQHEPAMEGLGMTTHLQTGELLIVTTVLLLWAAVIALFCRQYDIIKDNDSSSSRDKAKRPLVRAPRPTTTPRPAARRSTTRSRAQQQEPLYQRSPSNKCCHFVGIISKNEPYEKLHRASSSISIIRV
ncbi:Fibronectin type III domain containing protein 4 [Dissostichus eleginoides]|uniref:Fibronectin type III domain containing protein 4 n=1 Tax=Dissostichus eleginoides TaxID=100907 RepID=A0AAD9EP89_DISEL|nr:Fibronectin type III domain containing protein 4 [Dissostichus eleginoides]